MINKIKSAIGISDVKSLYEKSTSIVDVFTKTVNDLQEVNGRAVVAVDTREEQITKLREENQKLNSLVDNNTRIANKLTSILRD